MDQCAWEDRTDLTRRKDPSRTQDFKKLRALRDPQRAQSENAEDDDREHENAAEVVEAERQHQGREHRQYEQDERADARPVGVGVQAATGEPAGDGEDKPDAGNDGEAAEDELSQ